MVRNLSWPAVSHYSRRRRQIQPQLLKPKLFQVVIKCTTTHNLQFDCLAIKVYRSDFLFSKKNTENIQVKWYRRREGGGVFKTYKVHANGADVRLGVCVILKSNRHIAQEASDKQTW